MDSGAVLDGKVIVATSADHPDRRTSALALDRQLIPASLEIEPDFVGLPAEGPMEVLGSVVGQRHHRPAMLLP